MAGSEQVGRDHSRLFASEVLLKTLNVLCASPSAVIASLSVLSAAALSGSTGSDAWLILWPAQGPCVLCAALAGWVRWQVPSGQAALPVLRGTAHWGFKFLGFSWDVRGKKIRKYWEWRRHKKLSDEASGDAENWVCTFKIGSVLLLQILLDWILWPPY